MEGAPAQDTTPWCSRGRGARDTAPTLDRVLVQVPPVGVDALSRCRASHWSVTERVQGQGQPLSRHGRGQMGLRGQGDREHWGSVGGSPLPSRSPGQERGTGTVSRQGGLGRQSQWQVSGGSLSPPPTGWVGHPLSTTTGHRVSSHHRTPAQTAPDPVCQRGALQGLRLDKGMR